MAVSTGGALLLDGQPGTVLVGALGGLWLGLLFQVAGRLGDGGRLLPVFAAFGCTVFAHALGQVMPVDLELGALSGLLVLLPGLSLTIGVAEVASGHLSAGAARLTGASVTLLLLGLGVTAGSALIPPSPILEAPPLLAAVPLGLWLSVGGLVTLFKARRAQLPWLAFGLLLAWGLPLLLGDLRPTAIDFTTAAVLGLCGSLLARQRRMPAQVLTLPGILLLVPGGRALRAVDALLRHDLQGIQILADSLATSGALVAGLLLAGLALPPQPRLTPPRRPAAGALRPAGDGVPARS